MILKHHRNIIFPIIILLSFVIPLAAGLTKNDAAPKINLRDMDNRLVFVFNELKNRPVLVAFFFTGCVPCKKELPELQNLYSRYGSDVAMYLISTDTEGADVVRPYIDKMKITIPVLIDKYSDVARLYGVDRYPSVFLIGRNGKVMFSSYGYSGDNMKQLEEILEKIKRQEIR